MRNSYCKFKTGLALFLASGMTVLGADAGDWANVEALRRGDRIGIVQADQKRVEGRLESASGSAIVLQDSGASIGRENVVRVYRLGMSKKKRMLIGAAIGLGAGAVVAATVSQRLNNEGVFSGSSGGAVAAGTVAGSAGIGLAIGGLSGSGQHTVYQRKAGN